MGIATLNPSYALLPKFPMQPNQHCTSSCLRYQSPFLSLHIQAINLARSPLSAGG